VSMPTHFPIRHAVWGVADREGNDRSLARSPAAAVVQAGRSPVWAPQRQPTPLPVNHKIGRANRTRSVAYSERCIYAAIHRPACRVGHVYTLCVLHTGDATNKGCTRSLRISPRHRFPALLITRLISPVWRGAAAGCDLRRQALTRKMPFDPWVATVFQG
jgi:hypothetical protein